MKLTTRDIPGFLQKRTDKAAVLIYGPDRGMMKDRADQVARHVVPDLHDPFNIVIMSGAQVAEDPARFLDETKSLSLMGGARVIRITDPSDSITPTLKSYLAAPSPDCLVVIEGDDLPAKSTLRKLCETETNAAALPCYVQEGDELSRTIAMTLKSQGLSITPDALDLLTASIGGNHHQVQSELDKLITYMPPAPSGSKTIDADDVTACCGTMGLAGLDAFVDAFMNGQTETVFTLMPRLIDDGIPMIAILRTVLNHGRKLQGTHLRIASGEHLDSILDAKVGAPVFFKRKAAFRSQIRRWPLPRLERLMHDILMCEMRLKSGQDPDVAIPQALLALSARAAKAA